MTSVSQKSVVLIWCIALGACGSSPPVRYFSLDTGEYDTTPTEMGARSIQVGPLRFPEYLTRTQIVVRGPGNELVVDDFNRWIEPLDEAVHRAIAAKIEERTEGLIAVSFPGGLETETDYRLIGSVDHLDVDQMRRARFDIQWSIVDRNGNTLIAPKRSGFVSVAETLSVNDMVSAIDDTILQFSRVIAAEVTALADDTQSEE